MSRLRSESVGLGTHIRETPCRKCGNSEFYVIGGQCVSCQIARNAEITAERRRKAEADGRPTGRQKRKTKEARSDRAGVNDMLSRKW